MQRARRGGGIGESEGHGQVPVQRDIAAEPSHSAAARKSETKKAVTVAKSVIRAFPEEHAFLTGSKGRSVKQSVEIDGRKAFLNVTLVWSDTVVKAEKVDA